MTTPRTDTAIATALKRAGMNTDEARLRQLAMDAMAKCHNNTKRASLAFAIAVLDTGERALIKELCKFYLVNYKLPAGGQTPVDARYMSAASRQPNGDDSGHKSVNDQCERAASSSRGGAGQTSRATHPTFARPVREPTAAQRASEARIAHKISVLDTFKIGGRAIGDWSVVAAKSEGPHMIFHGQVLRELTAEAERTIANIESWMTFRDVLTEAQFHRAIQRASGVDHVQ